MVGLADDGGQFHNWKRDKHKMIWNEVADLTFDG